MHKFCFFKLLLLFFLFSIFCETECSSLFCVVQSVDVVKYTEEEYEKYLTDPVGIYSWLYLLLLFFFFLKFSA